MAGKGKRGPNKGEGGRPRWELTDERYHTVVAAMRIQCTREEICGMLDVDPDTLNARLKERGDETFSVLYEKHSGEGRASLRRQQFETAKAGNATMQIWLGKQWLGQTDKVVNEHTGKDGGPIQTEEVSARDRIAGKLARLATPGSAESDPGGTD